MSIFFLFRGQLARKSGNKKTERPSATRPGCYQDKRSSLGVEDLVIQSLTKEEDFIVDLGASGKSFDSAKSTPASALPKVIPPSGRDAKRERYLYEEIREFC